MDRRFVLRATLVLPAMLASISTFAQQPRPGEPYRGGPPPTHMPPGDLPPELQKGDRVGQEFRNRQFVVDDWRQHGLERPPRGFHWVGLAGRYYLVRSSNWTVERVGP